MFSKVLTVIGILVALVGTLSENLTVVCYVSGALFSSIFDNPCESVTKIVTAAGIILAGLSKGLAEFGGGEDAGAE
jgi:divalent metal cation (Fe/Co/Zn/Cd) transporter